MNLYETLKEVIEDIDISSIDEAKSDYHVTQVLKLLLCTKTSDASYDMWSKEITGK